MDKATVDSAPLVRQFLSAGVGNFLGFSQRAAELGGVLDISKLIENISTQGKPAFAITDVDEIVRHLTQELRSGDVVAIMSNGAFGGIHEKLMAELN